MNLVDEIDAVPPNKEKPFQHHEKPWIIFPNMPGGKEWPVEEGKTVIHVDGIMHKLERIYHYIEKTNQLFKITAEDTIAHYHQYMHRWHISIIFLTEIPITPAWRLKIDEYIAKYSGSKGAKIEIKEEKIGKQAQKYFV